MTAADRIALTLGRLLIDNESKTDLIAALNAEKEKALSELATLKGEPRDADARLSQ